MDYLLTNYIFAVRCDYCETIKEMFYAVPLNNSEVNDLLKVDEWPYSKESVKAVTCRTVMNKCNRRYTYRSEALGVETVYGYFRKLLWGKNENCICHIKL